MFTGIIEEVGTIKQIQKNPASAVLTIAADTVLEQTKIGDSIAVNGVCLTVTDLKAGSFTADVMHETLRRSSLGSVRPGSPVNLERAMQLGGRFGGHIVSGHIDATGKILGIREDDNAVWYRIGADYKILKYIVEKGNDQKYGARPLRRAMQTELEDKLAEAILDGEICEGMDVEVGVSKKELKFVTVQPCTKSGEKDTKN